MYLSVASVLEGVAKCWAAEYMEFPRSLEEERSGCEIFIPWPERIFPSNKTFLNIYSYWMSDLLLAPETHTFVVRASRREGNL